MDDVSTCFATLGLKPEATSDEARQAYRDLVRVWHPDRFAHDERLRLVAQEKLKEINRAYQILQNHFANPSQSPVADAGTPESRDAEAEPEEASAYGGVRAAVWIGVILSGLVLLTLAGVAYFHLKKSRLPSSEAAASAATPIASHSLSFTGHQSQVGIATTGTLAGTFTVECWAMNRRSKGTATVLAARGPQDYSFNLKFREGKRFHTDIGDGSRWLKKMANAAFRYNPNIWYHVACVVTPTNYLIYINGAVWGRGMIYPPGQPVLFSPQHHLLIGADGMDEDRLEGGIAELRIWNVARTEYQIKSKMYQSLRGHDEGLVGYWRFSEGRGNTSADASGHGSLASLSGGVTWSTNAPPELRLPSSASADVRAN